MAQFEVVNKMKKILKSILLLLVCSFVFTVNVSAATDYKYDENKVKLSVMELVKSLVNMDKDELEYYANNSVGWTKNASEVLLDYKNNDTLGEFKSLSEATLKEDGQLLKIEITARYEKANLEIVTTMSNIAGEIVPVSIDFDLVDIGDETLGEKMQNALFNSIIGLCSVFLVLLLISFIIYLFKYIPKIMEIFTKKDKGSVSVALEEAIAQIEGKEELVDDMELVAVITAAICASTGASSDSFVVRSIRKADRKKKHI